MTYRSTSTSSRMHEDRIRRPYKEDHGQPSRSRSEEERDRLRREWLRQEKLKREHEKLKKEKIIEYEMKRARIVQISRRRRSNSRSRSAERHSSKSQGTNTLLASAPVFNGPEGLKISLADMCKVHVTIHNIGVPASAKSTEIVRDLINPTDLIVRRRHGEGTKPIFEREELSQPFRGDETDEQTRIITVNSDNTGETQYSKRRSASLSPTRGQTYRLHRSSSRRSRRDGSKHRESRTDYYPRRKSCSDRSRERSTERWDRFKDEDSKKPTTSRATIEESSRRHEDRRDRGRSKERKPRSRDRASSSHRSSKGDRSYRDYRERSSDRFHDRWRRERSPGSSIAPPHYIEQVPVPIYFGPRPMMVGPIMPYRGQVPMGRGRPAPVMGPVGPYRQRFVPPNLMYRLAPPPNPRFGPYNTY